MHEFLTQVFLQTNVPTFDTKERREYEQRVTFYTLNFYRWNPIIVKKLANLYCVAIKHHDGLLYSEVM